MYMYVVVVVPCACAYVHVVHVHVHMEQPRMRGHSVISGVPCPWWLEAPGLVGVSSYGFVSKESSPGVTIISRGCPPRARVFSTIPSPPRRALRRLPAAILQPSAADEGRKAALRGGEGTLPRLARVQHPQPLRRPLGQLVQPRAQTCLKNSSVEL